MPTTANLASHIRNTVANFLQAERDQAYEERRASVVGTLHHTPGALLGTESGEAEVQLGMLDGVYVVHVRLGGALVGSWTPGTNAARLAAGGQRRAAKAALALQKQQAQAVLRIAQIAVADALRALEAA